MVDLVEGLVPDPGAGVHQAYIDGFIRRFQTSPQWSFEEEELGRAVDRIVEVCGVKTDATEEWIYPVHAADDIEMLD